MSVFDFLNQATAYLWISSKQIFHQDHRSLPQEIWPRRRRAATDFHEAFYSRTASSFWQCLQYGTAGQQSENFRMENLRFHLSPCVIISFKVRRYIVQEEWISRHSERFPYTFFFFFFLNTACNLCTDQKVLYAV